MVAYAKAELPNEACGLLAGTINEAGKVVKKVYCLTNMDHSPNHFSLSVEEQFAAIKDIRAKGYELLGNWHSHPRTDAMLSDEDKRLAYDRKASYTILSLKDMNEPVLKAFCYLENVFLEEEIQMEL